MHIRTLQKYLLKYYLGSIVIRWPMSSQSWREAEFRASGLDEPLPNESPPANWQMHANRPGKGCAIGMNKGGGRRCSTDMSTNSWAKLKRGKAAIGKNKCKN